MAVASEKINDNITDPVIHGLQPWKVKSLLLKFFLKKTLRAESSGCELKSDFWCLPNHGLINYVNRRRI